MKSNYVAVSVFVVIVLGIAGFAYQSIRSSEVKKSQGRIENVIKLRLEYEDAIKKYESLDSVSWNYEDDKKACLCDAEDARKKYLNAFANLSEEERDTYKTLESEVKSADKEYLGSVYEEDEDSADKKYQKLEATYTNVMQ